MNLRWQMNERIQVFYGLNVFKCKNNSAWMNVYEIIRKGILSTKLECMVGKCNLNTKGRKATQERQQQQQSSVWIASNIYEF